MRFNPKARLDTSQVRVRRGGRSGGGSAVRLPGGGKVGGVGGFLLLVLVFVITQYTGGTTQSGGQNPFGFPLQGVTSSETGDIEGVPQCRSGEDANRDELCALVATVNSVQAFWDQALPEMANLTYASSKTEFFDGQTSTACGPADSSVGPFYCPADKTVYLDTSFFDEMLEGQLGARGGAFAPAYVLAHEYGHHIQGLTGVLRRKLSQGPEGGAVRLELQADCYAGLWTRYATQVPNAEGDVLILELTRTDIDVALDAAAAVGDDRIQERSGGRIDPDTWTHGSARARQHWFMVGYEKGSFQACDTFSADELNL